jgi:hypothetical protein
MSHKQEQLALILARQLLNALRDPNAQATIPLRVREQAAVVLRHFPSNAKLDLLYAAVKKAPPNDLQ